MMGLLLVFTYLLLLALSGETERITTWYGIAGRVLMVGGLCSVGTYTGLSVAHHLIGRGVDPPE